MIEIEQPNQNGAEFITDEDVDSKARPADIEQDMREMERRKRVEAIMGSKLFREELERIVDSQIREGGSSGILQQLSDIVGIPTSRAGNVFKSSNCVLPINDIRGVESIGYSKGEKILRCKLGASFRLLDMYGWANGLGVQITARLKVDQEQFLVNPFGLLSHEVTASSLNKVDMQGNIVEQGTTNFGVNKNHFILHSVVHAARPDIRCAIYIGCNAVVAVSSLKIGLLPLTYDSVVLGEISAHQYTGSLIDVEEREKLVRSLGPVSKVILLSNYGALCCGETIEEAFFAANHIVKACETQLKLLPLGVENLSMIPEESRKTIFDAARRPPEDIIDAFEKKAVISCEDTSTADESQAENKKDTNKLIQQPKWRVGGAEFEALMRMLDNAGFRTGYIYRNPLIKSELPKPKNDVELPPAVSSLGYLLEEEELYRQGIWKKSDWRKGGDRTRWLNSPNVYQKVEVLETGTPDPKKITKWVAEGSPTHSTPVRIESALQFVPTGTNSKEFKKVQQQIKDNRRADKISAGPQSHILEGVTWDEANRIKDATVSSVGDHVVLMGAASKGIIQRGFQHNATVYKAPYAKNPFDNVTDDELNEYKRNVEKQKNIQGEYTDTDFSESDAISSLQTSDAQKLMSSKAAVVSHSESEGASEHHVMSIETKQAPVPCQAEVVLSDDKEIITKQDKTTLLEEDFKLLCRDITSSMRENLIEVPKMNFKPFSSQIQKLDSSTELISLNKYISESSPALSDVKSDFKFKIPLVFKTPFDKVLRNEVKPYRTYSHFGYNYTNLKSTPKHFHISISANNFIARKKPFTYNEIFSSPRFVDLCEKCFQKVVCNYHVDFVRNDPSKLLCMSLLDGSRGDFDENECEESKQETNKKYFRSIKFLEPLKNIHEKKYMTPQENIEVDENLTFCDKIMKMNYSDESFNLSFQTSKAISSEISINVNTFNMIHELSIDELIFQTARNANINFVEEISANNSVEKCRKLMSREERHQRKCEFSELWEDHIQYYGTRRESDSDTEVHKNFEILTGNNILRCLDYSNSLFPNKAFYNIENPSRVYQKSIVFENGRKIDGRISKLNKTTLINKSMQKEGAEVQFKTNFKNLHEPHLLEKFLIQQKKKLSTEDSPALRHTRRNKPTKMLTKLIPDYGPCKSEQRNNSNNFIVDNIRNAYVPFHKSTFSICKSKSQIISKKINPPIYSFQTKMVGESPRFWVTLPSMEN